MRSHSYLRVPIAAACLVGAACGERVTLADAEGWVELSYRCENVESHAHSSAERALVREYAGRLIYQASVDNTMEVVQPLLRADVEGGPEDLERAVVDLLCREVPIAPRPAVQSARAEARVRGLDVHVPAPDFVAPLLDSAYLKGEREHVRLSELRGEYVILNFWSTWCGPCKAEHPDLVRLAERFDGRGLRVLGVLHRDGADLALKWLEANPAGPYRTVIDEDGRIAELYDVDGIPHLYLIDRDGQIIANSLVMPIDSLAARLDVLLRS